MADEFARHLDLPSGGSVAFYSPEDLTGDDHRRIIDLVRDEAGDIGRSMDVAYGCACMLIEAWHIPYAPKGTPFTAGEVPVPSTDPAILGRLRLPDYHAIITAVTPAVRALFPRAATPDDAQRPGSPTGPASV